MSSSSDDAPCGSCQQLVCRGQKGLDCDLCNSWYHIECAPVSTTCYNAIRKATASCGSALPDALLSTVLSRNWRFLVLRTLRYEKRFAKFVRLLNRLRVQEIVRSSKSHRVPLAAILEWIRPVPVLLCVLSQMMHYMYLANEKKERRKQDIARRATFQMQEHASKTHQ